MATTGWRALSGMITPRRMAYLVAWVRMITGAAWLLAPEASPRPWAGAAGSDAGAVTRARLIGSRDVVLGVGLLRALRRGRGAREWVAYSSIVDGADALSTVVVLRQLPRAGQRIAALLAVGALVGGWTAARLDSD
jgi:hypothetical protein